MFLDVVVILLLGATIAFCVILNRRLVVLRGQQTEFATLVNRLNDAAARAEAGVAGLKSNAEQVGVNLQASIDRARRLSEELAGQAGAGVRPSERDRLVPDEEPAGARAAGGRRKRLEQEYLSILKAAR
jgi:hypothetical protein